MSNRSVSQKTRRPAPKRKAGGRGHRGDEILAAAQNEFLLHGYRRTSIDTIAQAAGVAKGTVYLYFDSKEAVFRAVSQKLIDFFLVGAREAANEPGPAAQRLGAVLLAKFGVVYGMAAESPYGSELVASSESVSADLYKKGDEQFVEIIAGVLAREKTLKLDPKDAAWMVFRSAHGCNLTQRGPVSGAEIRRRLYELAEVMLAGLT